MSSGRAGAMKLVPLVGKSGGGGGGMKGGDARVDEGKLNVHVPSLSCAFRFSHVPRRQRLNHLVSHLSHCLSPSPCTSHNDHTTTTIMQCPRLRPDMTSRLTIFSPLAQARAPKGRRHFPSPLGLPPSREG